MQKAQLELQSFFISWKIELAKKTNITNVFVGAEKVVC